MDYEKAYKEALERAKNLHGDAIDMGENIRAKQCEIIFPELAESEDARIRKALIRYHQSTINIDGVKGEEILAWLEKQGETSPVLSNSLNIGKDERDEKIRQDVISHLKYLAMYCKESMPDVEEWIEWVKKA